MNVQVGMQVIIPVLTMAILLVVWTCKLACKLPSQHNGNVFALIYLHNGKVDFCLPAQYDKVQLYWSFIRSLSKI